MPGLVEEIQRDALDANVRVSTLLRRVKLAAAKLDLPFIEAWVESELNGYNGDIPDYRRFKGVPKAHNPFRGWIAIQAPAEIYEKISETTTGQSVAQLEDLLRSDDSNSFHTPMNRGLIDALNHGMHFKLGEMSVFVGRSDLAGVLDRVRNLVLDWAIALEKSGIKGEDMSFSPEEKSAAQKDASITIGSVGTLIGVLGNNNNVRDIAGGDINVAQVKDLAQQMNSAHSSLVEAGADAQSLSSAVNGLIAETDKAEPNPGVLRGLLTDARSALSGAAGNLLASGALTGIAAILGS
jgi:hypothetical protein